MNTVFLDIDTQMDFLFPAGALYMPGAETIVGRVAELNRYAAARGIPLISTMDAHAENDPEFRVYPHHCVAGTLGQRKASETLVGQTIVEKHNLDCFSNPRLEGLLRELGAERCVLYGVATEICVKIAAEGLMRLGKRVEIVADAVRSLSQEASRAWLEDFRARGGQITHAPITA